MAWPSRAIMVTPKHFDVQYAINPHMLDENGRLNKVDQELAKQQWQTLKSKFEELSIEVLTIEGADGLPDMVFCANQSFPFLKEGRLHLALSKMQSVHRQNEVPFFRQWAKDNQAVVIEPPSSALEGMGDLLWDYENQRLFGGYGFRTSPEVYSEIEKFVGQKITTFELKNENFYHLDTCLSILQGDTAAYVKEAFTEEGLQTLRSHFDQLIEVPLAEATQQLACNMCTPNGKDILIQQGARVTIEKLTTAGFVVHELDTSEFIKSGGSVFCMKLLFP